MGKNEIENIDILNQIDILGELGDLSGNNSLEIKEKQKINFLENTLKDDFSKDNNISADNINEKTLNISIEDNINTEEKEDIVKLEVVEKIKEKKIISKKNKGQLKIFTGILFFIKYLATSAFIFVVLLVTTNYSAYINIVMSYVNQEEFNQNEQLLISSVKASYIKEKIVEKKQIDFKKEDIDEYSKNIHSIEKMIDKTSKENVDLNIEITPYENRIIIPKIGKNVPLLDVKNQMISSEKKLNSIFMKELENGVVKYPGTADPGKIGTTFIFGHSSNFPWIEGDYNEVFASLYKLEYGDKVIIYYGQEKFTYIIREKKIISPNDVDAIKRNNNKSEVTLMTCWPVGTTLNRLIVTGELVKE